MKRIDVFMNDMYDDCWVHKLSINEMVEKYGYMNIIFASEYHIAFTNSRCVEVRNAVGKGLGKKEKYEVGDGLVGRLFRSDGGDKLNVRILEKSYEQLLGRLTTEDVLCKHFRYTRCVTSHSARGAFVSKTSTIQEWDTPYSVSSEWDWCAMTRCVDFGSETN